MNSHYICEVSIKYRNHIILLLKNHKISIYSIFYKEDKMQIEVDEDGYQNILNLKVPYKIKISAYKGKVKLLSFFRKYRLFLFSALHIIICELPPSPDDGFFLFIRNSRNYKVGSISDIKK